jgi:hypothetical protein
MYKSLLITVLLLTLQSCAGHKSLSNKVTEKPFYGKEIKKTKAVKLDKVINNYSSFNKKDIVMEAQVEKVCAKKGCWMTLQGSKKTFRVKFHDYSYFVPMSLIGNKVWVEGRVMRKKLSIKDTKHYLEDAGASEKEIAAITKPSFEYRIIAKGVRVVN